MTTLALTINNTQKKVRSKINFTDLPMAEWKAMCFVLFAVALTMLIFYVLQINSLAKGSYVIDNYTQQITKLSEENKNLKISFAETSYLENALAKIKELNFGKVTSVKYIQMQGEEAKLQDNKNI